MCRTVKHVEVSRKIILSRKVSADELKAAFLTRIEKSMDVERATEGADEFSLNGTTGSPASLTRHARLDLDVSVKFDGNTARIIVSGYARPARSLAFMYLLLFVVMLLVGLLPGSIETSGDGSGALDALVFVIFGIYITMDINKKLSEPREFLETALESLNTQFG